MDRERFEGAIARRLIMHNRINDTYRLAPIVLFVYNRPWHAQQTLDALAQNELAGQSTLYIYSDGPKHLALAEDIDKITRVRRIIRSRKWCKKVAVVEARHNKGLADSIVGGVTEVIHKHGKVIVLEDDLVTNPGFLKYMNECLALYENESKVMQISGYIYGSPGKSLNQNTHFLRILGCNGWGTWKRAWDLYEHDVDRHLSRITVDKKTIRKFNIEGHANWYKQLLMNKDKTIYSWAVRWYASWWMAGGYNLFPKRSLLTNIGHDGSGVHGSRPFYNGETVDFLDVQKIPICESLSLRREIDKIWKRGLSSPKKLMIEAKLRIIKFLVALGMNRIRKPMRRVLRLIYPELGIFENKLIDWSVLVPSTRNSTISNLAKPYPPYHIRECQIGDYTYISKNSWISRTSIGKFCSIGPNLVCGWGIHPVDGISTHPMFYSTLKQNGMTLSATDKVQERKPIKIGNDVFIGMNVTILDGVAIGDGAVIGAGAVVSKDIPPFAIAVGNPIRILRYRFGKSTIKKLLKAKWWDWPPEDLRKIEKNIFNIDAFIKNHIDGQ